MTERRMKWLCVGVLAIAIVLAGLVASADPQREELERQAAVAECDDKEKDWPADTPEAYRETGCALIAEGDSADFEKLDEAVKEEGK